MQIFLEILNNSYHNILFILFFFVLGAILGSFFNVVVFRYPKMMDHDAAHEIKSWLEEKKLKIPEGIEKYEENINLNFPSSHCYNCHKSLKWYHNIPLLSYLFLKGKCGYCGVKISLQYPIVEFFAGLLLAFSYYYFTPILGFIGFSIISFYLLVTYLLLMIDFKTMYLPDSFNYLLLWFGIFIDAIYQPLFQLKLKEAILAVVIGYLILWIFAKMGKLLKGIDAMGDGDLKLVAAMGAFIGLKGVVFTIFASPIIGIITWIYFKVKGQKEPHFPFGPALILTSWIYLMFGSNILHYLGL